VDANGSKSAAQFVEPEAPTDAIGDARGPKGSLMVEPPGLAEKLAPPKSACHPIGVPVLLLVAAGQGVLADAKLAGKTGDTAGEGAGPVRSANKFSVPTPLDDAEPMDDPDPIIGVAAQALLLIPAVEGALPPNAFQDRSSRAEDVGAHVDGTAATGGRDGLGHWFAVFVAQGLSARFSVLSAHKLPPSTFSRSCCFIASGLLADAETTGGIGANADSKAKVSLP